MTGIWWALKYEVRADISRFFHILRTRSPKLFKMQDSTEELDNGSHQISVLVNIFFFIISLEF